jgi:DNA polymerase-4
VPGILHVDMDAFYVSVEVLDDPSLKNRPVVVGGEGARGVVASASYEARAFGVRSAMPSMEARRRCPQAVFLAGRFARYTEVSGQLFEIFRAYTPLVEGISLDEAFLDLRGTERLFGDPVHSAWRLRDQVKDDLGLDCSVGVSAVKMLAKLASEAAKPRATPNGPVPGSRVVVVEEGGELEFLHPRPVQALWGVGPKTLARLQGLGVATVGDLARLSVDAVTAALGQANGRHLHDLAWARDPRPVVPDRPAKSIGHEETFAVDHRSHDPLDAEAVRLADGVAARLRGAGLTARTVTIKVRFAGFDTITRSRTFERPVDGGVEVARAAKRLLADIDVSPGVRLFGVSVSGLAPRGPRQLSLDDLTARSWGEATPAVDEIRRRFGDRAIGPARLVGEGGLRIKRPGDTQWGPTGDG